MTCSLRDGDERSFRLCDSETDGFVPRVHKDEKDNEERFTFRIVIFRTYVVEIT